MRRKEQYADEIIEMLERTKGGAWASNINLNTKDRVIEVCQNCVDSWSGRKFKDHCTTPPQALEQTRWIPVSERLPRKGEYGKVLVTYIPSGGTLWTTVMIAHYSDLMGIAKPSFHIGEVGKESFQNITEQVTAWMPLPQPYKGESEE